jgi:hypothetical protein
VVKDHLQSIFQDKHLQDDCTVSDFEVGNMVNSN